MKRILFLLVGFLVISGFSITAAQTDEFDHITINGVKYAQEELDTKFKQIDIPIRPRDIYWPEDVATFTGPRLSDVLGEFSGKKVELYAWDDFTNVFPSELIGLYEPIIAISRNGDDLMKEIKADDRTKHIPIIAVTAYAMAGDKEKFLGMGFDAYMSKPVDLVSFIPTIEEMLQ